MRMFVGKRRCGFEGKTLEKMMKKKRKSTLPGYRVKGFDGAVSMHMLTRETCTELESCAMWN